MFKTLKINHRKKGFTLVEVIVASLVFALMVAGIMATITALSVPATESSEEVTAALIGKEVLENMRIAVSSDTFSNIFNETGGDSLNGTYTLAPIPSGGKTYTPAYVVRRDSINGAVQVNLTITWQD
jgi:prepilin-type N-terminal cleavage/methylation domain-containing protein